MFDEKDLQQIREHGLTPEQAETQLENFRRGFPFLNVVRAASPGDGVLVVGAAEADAAVERYEKESAGLGVVKFVPASGAATRMFKELFEFVNDGKRGKGIDTLLENIGKFAFWPELRAVLPAGADDRAIVNAIVGDGKVGERMTLLLTPGVSITQDKELFATTHKRHYQGRGSEQNNVQYNIRRFADIYDPDMHSLAPITPDQVKKAFQTRDSLFQIALEEDFKHLDPYWRKVFERSERYFEGMFVLEFYMRATDKQAWQESGLLDWQAPHFASVNPLIDFAYSLQKTGAATYYYFLYAY